MARRRVEADELWLLCQEATKARSGALLSLLRDLVRLHGSPEERLAFLEIENRLIFNETQGHVDLFDAEALQDELDGMVGLSLVRNQEPL